MTTRTRARHYDRPPTTHHPRIHPDWLPPTGAALPDLEPDAMSAHENYPGNSIAGRSPTTPLALGIEPGHAFVALPPIPPRPPRPVPEPLPLPPDQTPDDEDRALRTPVAAYDAGRDATLAHTALPLRHRIFALHAEGRSISAIARTLHLDRGTVARHLRAVQDLLLAEQQTDDLATLRLSAIAAQHAILAAAWDALAHEEALAADRDPATPPAHPPRRAQLLATAHRAARTAAQLQGLFTPAALAAALQAATLQPAAISAANCCAPASEMPTTPFAHGDECGNAIAGLAPVANAAAAANTSAAFCCMPASAPSSLSNLSSEPAVRVDAAPGHVIRMSKYAPAQATQQDSGSAQHHETASAPASPGGVKTPRAGRFYSLPM